MTTFDTGRFVIGPEGPTYFIADISANHDGQLDRAKKLVRLAAESGANAAKFQNFRADTIVSARGFEDLGSQVSHQATWVKSVVDVYREAELPSEWTWELRAECDAAGIDYFSAPYELGAVDYLDPYVSMFKIGSGDITWLEMIERVASKGKPVLLATGASDIGDVQRAVHLLESHGVPIVLMQCNTNYTGSLDNYRHVHLRVLETYSVLFPDVVLGLSDHTPGHATVLGAVALGARVIEKHFTDDRSRTGPDHPFSMGPDPWREMVEGTRELELALGSADKRVAENESETVVVQRRCLRAATDLSAGNVLGREMIDVLRPSPPGSVPPYDIGRIVGMSLRRDLARGEEIHLTDLDPSGRAT
jgi:sialic acid synthase SpsE